MALLLCAHGYQNQELQLPAPQPLTVSHSFNAVSLYHVNLVDAVQGFSLDSRLGFTNR